MAEELTGAQKAAIAAGAAVGVGALAAGLFYLLTRKPKAPTVPAAEGLRTAAVIADPHYGPNGAGHLPGALDEGNRLRSLFEHYQIDVTHLAATDSTGITVASALGAMQRDIATVAGHGTNNPVRLLFEDDALTATQAAQFTMPRRLFYASCCYSASDDTLPNAIARADGSYGYLGYVYPVSDADAPDFGVHVFDQWLGGIDLRSALHNATRDAWGMWHWKLYCSGAGAANEQARQSAFIEQLRAALGRVRARTWHDTITAALGGIGITFRPALQKENFRNPVTGMTENLLIGLIGDNPAFATVRDGVFTGWCDVGTLQAHGSAVSSSAMDALVARTVPALPADFRRVHLETFYRSYGGTNTIALYQHWVRVPVRTDMPTAAALDYTTLPALRGWRAFFDAEMPTKFPLTGDVRVEPDYYIAIAYSADTLGAVSVRNTAVRADLYRVIDLKSAEGVAYAKLIAAKLRLDGIIPGLVDTIKLEFVGMEPRLLFTDTALELLYVARFETAAASPRGVHAGKWYEAYTRDAITLASTRFGVAPEAVSAEEHIIKLKPADYLVKVNQCR